MARLGIEVIYAERLVQEVVVVTLEEGASALDALVASGLAMRYPDIDLQAPLLGIFGQQVTPDTALRDGDRVEVYRRLMLDPMEARRKRATANKRLRR